MKPTARMQRILREQSRQCWLRRIVLTGPQPIKFSAKGKK